jgi:hypothetical protein
MFLSIIYELTRLHNCVLVKDQYRGILLTNIQIVHEN